LRSFSLTLSFRISGWHRQTGKLFSVEIANVGEGFGVFYSVHRLDKISHGQAVIGRAG